MKFAEIQRSLRRRRNRDLAWGIWVLGGERRTSVLDVGGTREFWETLAADLPIDLVLLNMDPTTEGAVRGDARDLSSYATHSIDLVVSNSVIEHVGDFSRVLEARNEMRRVGRSGWVQTRAFSFPLEPHY